MQTLSFKTATIYLIYFFLHVKNILLEKFCICGWQNFKLPGAPKSAIFSPILWFSNVLLEHGLWQFLRRAIMTHQNCHHYFGSVFTRICPCAHTYPLGHSYLSQLWAAPQVFQKSLAGELLYISSERLKAVQTSRWTSQNITLALALRHTFQPQKHARCA